MSHISNYNYKSYVSMPMKEVNNKVQRLCQEVLQLYEAIICK